MTDNTASIALGQRPAQFACDPIADAKPGSIRSLYIHIPFCNHKCHYCDFYSLVDPQDRQAAFVDRLGDELRALSPFADRLETIFVGGGTPTLLLPELWQRLGKTLSERFDLTSPTLEFTVECNPETASAELFEILYALGVNRLSVGMQSFNPAHLKTLERVHDPAKVAKTFDLARQSGITNLSGDLIYAIPGQSLDQWADDLEEALKLGTCHLSCYNLTYEPCTALTARLERGLVSPCPEELEIEMFELTARLLGGAGFRRYEVSNYARPGFECRHNLAYWRQDQWLSAGPSASAHVAGHRWKNLPHLERYLSYSSEGFAPIMDHEPPGFVRAVAERIMTGLRLDEGLDLASILLQAENASPGAAERLQSEINAICTEGLLESDPSRLRLTERGILFADGIAARLMALV